MTSSPHDFVTVDMRGLKAALVARAQAERVSVSAVVRRAVQRELGLANESADHEALARSGAAAPSLPVCWPVCPRCRTVPAAALMASPP